MPAPMGRGAGLGNELIVWAKAIIAAQALSAHALHPAWGLNQRGYRHYFGTSRFDWFVWRALRTVLPTFRFGEAEYYAHGGGHLAEAVESFAREKRLQDRMAYVLEIEGLWGGLDILAPARKPLLGALLATRQTPDNLMAIDRAIPPERLRIAMHIRRGDFGAPIAEDSYRGRFNVALPIEWYAAIARSLVQTFGDDVHFLLVSDAPEAELAPITSETPNYTTTSAQSFTDISDLLAIAFSDFLVCSVSSFSLWAAAFAQARYAWFEPNLSPLGDFSAIWAHEDRQQDLDGPTQQSMAQVAQLRAAGERIRHRGIPVGINGKLPDELLTDLKRTLELKRRATDLIAYGVVSAS